MAKSHTKSHEFSIRAAVDKLQVEGAGDDAAMGLMSDRNSVAEFEMLEQECIAKYLENKGDKTEEKDTVNRDLIDAKVLELEVEIDKFKLEKAKV